MRRVQGAFLLLMLVFLLAACDNEGEGTRARASAPVAVATKALPRSTATPNAQDAPRPTVVPLSTAMAKRSAKVDALFNDIISPDSPGAAVMVIRKGKIVHSAGYGLANLEKGQRISPSNLFHIASIGKSFTALGIMILAEEGLLDYDEPIGEYLPELSWMGKGVTIRRLLYHTSGITNYNNDPTMADEMLELSATPGNAELLAVLSIEHDLDYRPGNKYDYSNTGYDVLGLVIERLSGQSYADFMQARIFAPLGMRHTFVIPNRAKRAGPLVAMSYADEDEDGEPEAYPSDPWDNLSGSGAIYSSVEDMFYYDQALYTDELVSQETLEEAFTSGTINNGTETDYGFAWEIGEYNDEWYVSHSGYWLAFDSYFLRFPDAELSIIVLYNWDYAEPDAGEAAFEIADIYQ